MVWTQSGPPLHLASHLPTATGPAQLPCRTTEVQRRQHPDGGGVGHHPRDPQDRRHVQNAHDRPPSGPPGLTQLAGQPCSGNRLHRHTRCNTHVPRMFHNCFHSSICPSVLSSRSVALETASTNTPGATHMFHGCSAHVPIHLYIPPSSRHATLLSRQIIDVAEPNTAVLASDMCSRNVLIVHPCNLHIIRLESQLSTPELQPPTMNLCL